MASKKGITITVIILASITAASFLLWVVPQENNSTFIVTDYEGYLDGVKNIHEVLQESIDSNFIDEILPVAGADGTSSEHPL